MEQFHGSQVTHIGGERLHRINRHVWREDELEPIESAGAEREEGGVMRDRLLPCDVCGEEVPKRDRIETSAAGARYQQHLKICRKCVSEWHARLEPPAAPGREEG
jgi:hypothetical protein